MDFQIDEATARTIRLALGGLFGTIILAALRPMKPVILKAVAAWSFSYVFGESVMHYFKIDSEHAIAVGGALSLLGMAGAQLIISVVEGLKAGDVIQVVLASFGYRRQAQGQDSATMNEMVSNRHGELDSNHSQNPPVHP